VIKPWLKFHKKFEKAKKWLKSGPERIDPEKVAKYLTWRAKEGNLRTGGACKHGTVKGDAEALTFINRTEHDDTTSMMKDAQCKMILKGLKGLEKDAKKEDPRKPISEAKLIVLYKQAKNGVVSHGWPIMQRTIAQTIRRQKGRVLLKKFKAWSAALLGLTSFGVLARTAILARKPNGDAPKVKHIKKVNRMVLVRLDKGPQTRAGIEVPGGTKTTGAVWAPAHNSGVLWREWLSFIKAREDCFGAVSSNDPAFIDEGGNPLTDLDIPDVDRIRTSSHPGMK